MAWIDHEPGVIDRIRALAAADRNAGINTVDVGQRRLTWDELFQEIEARTELGNGFYRAFESHKGTVAYDALGTSLR